MHRPSRCTSFARAEGPPQVQPWPVDLVRIPMATGRISLPRVMLPPAHGGKGGWFDLKSLVATDREITASVPLNFLTSATMRLDRITGHITIEGAKAYSSG